MGSITPSMHACRWRRWTDAEREREIPGLSSSSTKVHRSPKATDRKLNMFPILFYFLSEYWLNFPWKTLPRRQKIKFWNVKPCQVISWRPPRSPASQRTHKQPTNSHLSISETQHHNNPTASSSSVCCWLLQSLSEKSHLRQFLSLLKCIDILISKCYGFNRKLLTALDWSDNFLSSPPGLRPQPGDIMLVLEMAVHSDALDHKIDFDKFRLHRDFFGYFEILIDDYYFDFLRQHRTKVRRPLQEAVSIPFVVLSDWGTTKQSERLLSAFSQFSQSIVRSLSYLWPPNGRVHVLNIRFNIQPANILWTLNPEGTL